LSKEAIAGKNETKELLDNVDWDKHYPKAGTNQCPVHNDTTNATEAALCAPIFSFCKRSTVPAISCFLAKNSVLFSMSRKRS
jgi:hypothetical protein